MYKYLNAKYPGPPDSGQPRDMAEKRKPWTAEEEATWDALVARLNRDHPGRVHGFNTPEEEEAAWDDMNESIEPEFPGLRQRWFDKMIGAIETHPEELVDMDAFLEGFALGYLYERGDNSQNVEV
jgi:hypothetical protein